MSPAKRRRAADEIQEVLFISERRACRVLGQPRSTQRQERVIKTDEEPLKERMVALACDYGRYGYRRVTTMLKDEGWRVNHKRVERLWRQEGLKASQRQPKRRRLWLNDGSCIRPRPLYPNHVWSYDFVAERTTDGRPIRILNIIDEDTRECPATYVARQIKEADVLYILSELFVLRGAPNCIRSDNGSEFTAKMVREWLQRLGVKTLFIEPGGPWENGHIESFNGKMRDEPLNGEIFDTILEAGVIIERWRKTYNTIRPHSSLGYRPPAPEVRYPLSLPMSTN